MIETFLRFCFVLFCSSQLERPRFFDLDETKIGFLKQKIENEDYPYFEFFDTVKSHADKYSPGTCPATATSLSYTTALPSLALVYYITEDVTYLDNAIWWMDCLASISWGHIPQQASSLTLSGFAVAFDWLYDEISKDSTRKTNYINRMVTEMEGYYGCLKYDVLTHYSTANGWCINYLHNLFGPYSGGIGTAALTISGESGVNTEFIQNVTSKLYEYYSLLIEQSLLDGTQVEGWSYIGYYVGNQVKYYQLEEKLLNEFRIRDSVYYRDLVKFRLYGSVNYWDYIKFADVQYRDNFNPYMYTIANRLKDAHPKEAGLTQWTANKITSQRALAKSEGGGGWGYWGSGTNYLTLVEYDETIVEVDPVSYGLPLERLFDDMGIYISRDSWDDSDNTVMYFKVGDPFGKSALEKVGGWDSMYPQDRGVMCHIHPDFGSVHLYFKGEAVLLEDAYVWLNRGLSHNIITFDGEGQYGENDPSITIYSRTLVRKEQGTSEIVHTFFDEKEGVEYLVGNLTRMYPLRHGLELYLRHFLYVKKKYLFVFDDILFNSTVDHTGMRITQNFHVERDGTVMDPELDAQTFTHFHSNEEIGLRIFDVSGDSLETIIESGDYDMDCGPSDDSGMFSTLLNVTHIYDKNSDEQERLLFRTIIIPFQCNDTCSEDLLPSLNFKNTETDKRGRKTKVTFKDGFQVSINVDTFEILVNEDAKKKEEEEKEKEKKKREALAITLSVVVSVSSVTIIVVVVIFIVLISMVCWKKKKSPYFDESKNEGSFEELQTNT